MKNFMDEEAKGVSGVGLIFSTSKATPPDNWNRLYETVDGYLEENGLQDMVDTSVDDGGNITLVLTDDFKRYFDQNHTEQ